MERSNIASRYLPRECRSTITLGEGMTAEYSTVDFLESLLIFSRDANQLSAEYSTPPPPQTLKRSPLGIHPHRRSPHLIPVAHYFSNLKEATRKSCRKRRVKSSLGIKKRGERERKIQLTIPGTPPATEI